jgi:hypothetical protein
LVNVLGVSASGAVFLTMHDSSSITASIQNISYLPLKAIKDVGPSNVIQVILAMQQIVREQGKSLIGCILTSFGLGVWCTH